MRMRWGVVVMVCVGALGTAAKAGHYRVAVSPDGDDQFKSAEYSLWIPPGVQKVRAIILHQHGCGRNGITVPHDLHWQALAKKHGAALMGSHLVPHEKCTDWHEPHRGSGDAFLRAIALLAEQSMHAELVDAPWCLWGHSGGAYWALPMAARYPERVVAAFLRSGGHPEDAKDCFDVPVMFQLGAREGMEGNRFNRLFAGAKAAYDEGRRQGAVWTWAVDPKSEHDTRNSRLLAIPYFDACLTQRLPAAAGEGGVKLRPVDRTTVWFGDISTLDIGSRHEFFGDRARVTWLPDEATARRWQEFVTTGDVIDTSPPPAPTGVRASLTGGRVALTWECDADLDSGIKAFRIYRDGTHLLTLPARPGLKNGASFQAGNYGDEPEPAEVAMSAVDASPAYVPSRYEVAAVNRSDRESARSEPALVTAD